MLPSPKSLIDSIRRGEHLRATRARVLFQFEEFPAECASHWRIQFPQISFRGRRQLEAIWQESAPRFCEELAERTTLATFGLF